MYYLYRLTQIFKSDRFRFILAYLIFCDKDIHTAIFAYISPIFSIFLTLLKHLLNNLLDNNYNFFVYDCVLP